MQPIIISIAGLNQFIGRLKALPKELRDEADAELKDGANRIAGRATRYAPVDEGGIRRGIHVKKGVPLEYQVISNARYSPYLEFGTKKKVQVPAELSAYAQQFKGKGVGTYAEFIKALTSWVRRKGIKFQGTATYTRGKNKGSRKALNYQQTAQIIAMYILKYGINPQPFFFRSLKEEEPEIIRNIENILKALS